MSQATLTLKTGPAQQVTSQVLANITTITFDCVAEVLTVGFGAEPNSAPYKEYELSGANTITLTASGGSYTLTIT